MGGTGNVCYYNAKELTKRGYKVEVFTAKYTDISVYERIKDIQIHPLRSFLRIGNAPIIPQIIWVLRDFDLIHLHMPFITGAELTSLSSLLFRIPLVVTYHSDLIPSGSWRDILFRIATQTSRFFVLNRAQKIIFVSEGHARTCDQSDILIKRRKSCRIVPNGIDTRLFAPGPDREAVRVFLGVPVNSKVGGFVGKLDRAHHYKGLNILLEALSHENLNGVHLLVIGDGDMCNEYRQQAARLGIINRVHFLGDNSQDQLPPLYRACDVIVMPSIVNESFGLVAAEALSCGIPVIASDGPGLHGFLNDGKSGYFINPGDVIDLSDKLLKFFSLTPRKQRILGNNGRKKIIDNFTWEHSIDLLDSIYQDIIKEGGNP
jgi:glycosyltransferase involved in cell wall biosynthesis